MNARGMTLLEVMVALMILSIVSLALMQTTGEQIRHLSTLEKKQFAMLVAENQLARLTLSGGWPESSWFKGSADAAGRRWHWQSRGVVTADPTIRGVEIEVREVPDGRPLVMLQGWLVKHAEP